MTLVHGFELPNYIFHRALLSRPPESDSSSLLNRHNANGNEADLPNGLYVHGSLPKTDGSFRALHSPFPIKILQEMNHLAR